MTDRVEVKIRQRHTSLRTDVSAPATGTGG
jgi:hypothetical protein